MNVALANLLTKDHSKLRHAARNIVHGHRGSAAILLVLLAVAVVVATVYYVWRWQRRVAKEPGSRALLKLGAGQIGLKSAHCRLLCRLGRAAGLEPMVALVSPQLFTLMVQQGKEAGVKLTKEEGRQLSHILDTVSGAADSGGVQDSADSTDTMR